MRRLLAALALLLAAGPALAQSTSPFNGVSIGAAPGCQTTGVFVLAGNNTGGCKNITIGSGLAFDGTTLTSTGSGGSVTSVGLSAPGIFSVSGSPVTTAGTLGLTLVTQTANFVWAGPTSGGAATPTFRSLVRADMPAGVAYYDTNQSWTAAQRQPLVTVSPSGATFTPNFDTGQSFSMTLPHASCPCALANPSTTPVPGQVGVIQWVQDATGGAQVTTWGSFYYAAGGTPTLGFTTTASHQDIWSYVVISPTEIVLLPGATDVFH